MKNVLLTSILILLTTGLSIPTQGQQQAEPQNKLIEFQMALLKRGPKWSPHPGKDSTTIHDVVFRVGSLEEARALAANDPAVQAGRLALDIHAWIVPEGILP